MCEADEPCASPDPHAFGASQGPTTLARSRHPCLPLDCSSLFGRGGGEGWVDAHYHPSPLPGWRRSRRPPSVQGQVVVPHVYCSLGLLVAAPNAVVDHDPAQGSELPHDKNMSPATTRRIPKREDSQHLCLPFVTFGRLFALFALLAVLSPLSLRYKSV